MIESYFEDQRRRKIAEFIMKSDNLEDVSRAFAKLNISMKSFAKGEVSKVVEIVKF